MCIYWDPSPKIFTFITSKSLTGLARTHMLTHSLFINTEMDTVKLYFVLGFCTALSMPLGENAKG